MDSNIVKVTCDECDWHGMSTEYLTAENPFIDGDIVVGCPKCFAVDSMVGACDVDDCWKPVTCGTPTSDGYRNTCSKHKPETDFTL